MNRRDSSTTIALCLSLTMHAGLLLVMVAMYVHDTRDIYLRGLSSKELERLRAQQEEPEEIPTYILRDRGNEMGEATGKGKASNSSPGDEPMHAMKAPEDQSWLSRDAQGPGSPENLPSPSVAPPGENGAGGHRASESSEEVDAAPFGAQPPVPETEMPSPRRATPTAAPTQVAAAPTPEAEKQLPDPVKPIPTPVVRLDHGIGTPTTAPTPKPPTEEEKRVEPPVAVAMATPAPTPPKSSPSPAAAAPGRPGAPVPAADPAPQSDSESDPFSSLGSVDFRAGRVDARFGRKVKTVRPRLTEAGKWDLASLQSPYMIFKVKIDETGKVTSVEVLRSSGSNNIDLPCRRALYEWWIEPLKDKDGHPIPDVMTWTLAFR